VLDQLSNGAWFGLVLGMCIGGFLFAWVADATLGRLSLGVPVSSGLSTSAGFGGLFAMDWAVRHGRIPYGFDGVQVWLFAAVAAATLAMLFIALVRSMISRI
jgi:hypothetical protein